MDGFDQTVNVKVCKTGQQGRVKHEASLYIFYFSPIASAVIQCSVNTNWMPCPVVLQDVATV